MNLGIDGRVITWHIGSGLATYTNNLLENLIKLKQLKNIFLFYPYTNGTDFFEINDIPQNLLIGERRLDFWRNVYELNWNINYPIDIFHNTVNGIGLPQYPKGVKVITLHDLIPYIMPETVDRPHLDYTLKYTSYILENISHVITVSYHSKSDIQRYFGIDDNKITVTHLAADPIFKPLDRDNAKKVIFNKYGVDKKYILYLGGFSKRKNIARLIRAFKKVVIEKEEIINLLILGEHSRSFKSLWQLTEELELCDYVKFLNFVPTADLPYFYNGAELFAYPSLYEGFGLPPLEAMQCGIPVITSDVSSIPEIVGDAALLTDPYSIDSISDSMLKLLTDGDEWHKYSLMGIEKAKEYSWLKTASETLGVYEKCIKNP
ncbi:MAG: glycosyltransferase family 1 protein [Clostridiaceae bacterium]|nr:glycosyltransferase family 1 protein [Clostridiaceae bacterium]